MEVWINRTFNGPADSHEYNVEVHDRTTTLSFSNNTSWTNPGKYTGGILDNGNGIEIELQYQNIKLSYFEAEQLLALLMAHYDGSMQLKETKIIKQL